MKLKFISSVTLASVLAAFAPTALAQTNANGGDGNLNQIQGVILFNPGSVLPGGMGSVSVQTSTVVGGVTKYASTTAVATSPTTNSYDVSVLSDNLVHQVSVTARDAATARDYYKFQTATSSPVPPEPAGAIPLSFAECSGAIQVNFVETAGGAPATVTNFSSDAHLELSTPGNFNGNWQARTYQSGSTSSEIYATWGNNANRRIDVDFRVGLVSLSQSFERTVACGETVVIEIPLDGAELPELGAIEGELDLQLGDELANSVMYAAWGPFNNSGSDTVVAGFGDFLIEDLLPSDFVDPVNDYQVYGQMDFPSVYGQQYFRTPSVSALVPEGATLDLGQTFVMQESNVGGQIELVGSTECMDRLSAGMIRSRWQGSSSTTSNGDAYQSPATSVSSSGTGAQLNSAYGLLLGVPNDQTGNWRQSFYAQNNDLNNSSLASRYYLYPTDTSNVSIAAGDVVDAPVEHCIVDVNAEVAINSGVTSGTTFNNPRLSFNGTNGTEYTMSGYANGSPLSSEAFGAAGEVPFCMPAGQYNFTTDVSAKSEAGVISNTTLISQTGLLDCGSIVKPFMFDFEIGEVGCPGGELGALPFEFTAKPLGGGGIAEEAYVQINGGPANGGWQIDLCGGDEPDCPKTGQFTETFDVLTDNLAQCGNSLKIFVLSESGGLSESAQKDFVFEQEEPAGQGCSDVALTLGGAPTASLDVFAQSSQLNQCGLDLESQTYCVVDGPTGSRQVLSDVLDGTALDLSAGAHTGQCFVNTGCGYRTCSFDVSVTD